MSARGYGLVTVRKGDPAPIREVLDGYIDSYQDGEPEEIRLEEINWLPVEDMIKAAPDASWEAYMDADTEESNTMFVYSPRLGLGQFPQLDYEPVLYLTKVQEVVASENPAEALDLCSPQPWLREFQEEA